jgi:hypothetical protein
MDGEIYSIDTNSLGLGVAEVNTNPNVTFNMGLTGDEMLRIAKDGFYVRGVKIEQDEREAEKVYNAFHQWLTWATLNRNY